MKLIVGPGNPGQEYKDTRHNLGFSVLELLSERSGIRLSSSKFSAESGQGTLAGERCILMRPQTFMNLSGQAVGPAAHFYKISPEDLIVIHDELDLPTGQIQLKRGGGTGGHNGLKSLVQCLGSHDFIRIRIGTGKPQGPGAKEKVVGFVLGKFSESEKTIMDQTIRQAADAVESILSQGLSKSMNAFNKRPS